MVWFVLTFPVAYGAYLWHRASPLLDREAVKSGAPYSPRGTPGVYGTACASWGAWSGGTGCHAEFADKVRRWPRTLGNAERSILLNSEGRCQVLCVNSVPLGDTLWLLVVRVVFP